MSTNSALVSTRSLAALATLAAWSAFAVWDVKRWRDLEELQSMLVTVGCEDPDAKADMVPRVDPSLSDLYNTWKNLGKLQKIAEIYHAAGEGFSPCSRTIFDECFRDFCNHRVKFKKLFWIACLEATSPSRCNGRLAMSEYQDALFSISQMSEMLSDGLADRFYQHFSEVEQFTWQKPSAEQLG